VPGHEMKNVQGCQKRKWDGNSSDLSKGKDQFWREIRTRCWGLGTQVGKKRTNVLKRPKPESKPKREKSVEKRCYPGYLSPPGGSKIQ